MLLTRLSTHPSSDTGSLTRIHHLSIEMPQLQDSVDYSRERKINARVLLHLPTLRVGVGVICPG